MFSQHHQHQQGLSETKTQILFWNGHRGFIISEAEKSDEKAHCDALRKISSWVESPFLQCALFAAYHHIHNHLHHSQLSSSKRVETPLVLRNQFRKGTEGGLSPGWVESPFAQSLLEFVSTHTISSLKGLLTEWLIDKDWRKSCPGHHQYLQLFTMQGIHLKEVTNCSGLLSKWCFCQNWDTGSALLMTLSDGRREVALMLIGSTFNLLLIVRQHKRCCR